MAGRAARFVWRERCDAVNWRMLRALDLADVVRRGDPALLEPLALHLTFARLPRTAMAAAAAPGDRDAWAVVRVLQMSMEYLLFMRSRDADVVDSLQQQLQLSERDLDEARSRVDKWKSRVRGGERQVDKLHQVLQNIAKLLHVHGASPSAVATIQTLLTELVVERRARQQGKRRQLDKDDAEDASAASRAVADDAQVCGRCGKLFSSPLYLQKHVARRHTSKTERSQPATRSPTATPVSNSSDNNSDELGAAQALAMQSLVHKFDQMLQAHEESFRLVSAHEANRVQHLYEQFHVEARLVEELKASRLNGEQELGAQREALDAMRREKSEVSSKLDELKGEIKRLTAQHKQLVDARAFESLPAPVASSEVESEASDGGSNAHQQMARLQTTLQEASEALEDTRVKLSRLQTEHLSAIREKQMLSDRLDQARDTIDRLEESAAGATGSVQPLIAVPTTLKIASVATNEADTQTPREATVDVTVQTDCTATTSSTADQPLQSRPIVQATSTQTELDPSRQIQVLRADASVQTSLDDVSKVDSAVGDDAVIQAQAADEAAPIITGNPETAETVRTGIPEYIQDVSSRELVDMVMTRSEREAVSASRAISPGSKPSQGTKAYSSIPRRSYLRSHFFHPEEAVKDRITHCLEKVDVFAGRFGVSARSGQVLSDEHFGLVRQALHAHLEVLPTDVLDCMVQCETAVNELIETEWVPRERTREQALEQFKLATHAKSAVNQALAKQALAAFRSRSPRKTEGGVHQVLRGNSQEEADAERHANRSKGAAGDVSDGGDPRRSPRADSQQDATLGGSTLEEEKCVPLDAVGGGGGEDLGDPQRHSHWHSGTHEATSFDSDAAGSRQGLVSEAKPIHPGSDEVPAPVSADSLPSEPYQTLVDAADSPRDDVQSSFTFNATDQEQHKSEGTHSSASCDLTDGLGISSFNDPNAVLLHDDQELVDALADARPQASLPQTAVELHQLDPSEYADTQVEEADDPTNDTSPPLSAPTTPELARSLEDPAQSERSLSMVASSELSFSASVPCLDDSRGDAEATQLDETLPFDPSDGETSETNTPAMDECEMIESYEGDDLPALQQLDPGASDHVDSIPRGMTDSEEGLRADFSSRSPPRPAPSDDDDIEEIELE